MKLVLVSLGRYWSLLSKIYLNDRNQPSRYVFITSYVMVDQKIAFLTRKCPKTVGFTLFQNSGIIIGHWTVTGLIVGVNFLWKFFRTSSVLKLYLNLTNVKPSSELTTRFTSWCQLTPAGVPTNPPKIMFSFSNPTETLKFQIPHIASVWGQEQAASSYIGQKFLPPNMASVEAIEQKGANTPRSPLSITTHYIEYFGGQ